ncbi:hypothetical protein Nepgr_026153 [Nepenthes gracilis]|uniref:Uncharacterized protein n=1 Tax=Nepenthes gracilis TaxID=150966 RepID=A0AAD3T7C2_NEPGR|nr:hypothetical protein Nepgr_026153 [Nepenthes gracilis]
MAATFKLKLMALLLVYSMILLAQTNKTWGARVCPEYCIPDVSYMTCPSSGDEKLPASCNCCLSGATAGCILYSSDGTPISNCE